MSDRPFASRWRLRSGANAWYVSAVVGGIALLVGVPSAAGLLRALRRGSEWGPSALGLAVALGAALLGVSLRPRSRDARVRLVEHRGPDGRVRWAQWFPIDRSRSIAAALGLLSWSVVPAILAVGLLQQGRSGVAAVPGAFTLLLAGIAAAAFAGGAAARRAVLLTADGLLLVQGREEVEIAWDRITRVHAVVHAVRHNEHRWIGLDVHDPEGLREGPRLLRRNTANAARLGAHLAIPEVGLAVDPRTLRSALEHYRADPDERPHLPDHHWESGEEAPRRRASDARP